MHSKILGLILVIFLTSSIYSTDIDSKLTPEITTKIAEQLLNKDNGFKVNVSGLNIEKIKDPTANGYDLEADVESKIKADLTNQHYSNSGDYVILVQQPLESDKKVYRVISFTVGEGKKLTNIQEIALIGLTEAVTEERVHDDFSTVVDHVHQEEARIHGENDSLQEENTIVSEQQHIHDFVAAHVHQEDRVHRDTQTLFHNEARNHEYSSNNHASGLAAPVDDSSVFSHIKKLFGNEDNSERVHDSFEHVHQEEARVHD